MESTWLMNEHSEEKETASLVVDLHTSGQGQLPFRTRAHTMKSLRPPVRQRGIATLLILILVGLAVTVAVAGSLRHLQGSQSQTTALHAQTQAQMKAWAGVDIVFQYLQTVAGGGQLQMLVDGLQGQLPADMDISGMTGLTATITDLTDDDSRIWVDITAVTGASDSRARASSTIQVVYEISGGGALPPPAGPPSVITFNRNLRIDNNFTLETDAAADNLLGADGGRAYQVLVKGDVEINNNVSGISILRATDSIKVANNSVFDFLHSNGDIMLSNSARATQKLWARGNICVSNSGDTPDVEVRAGGAFSSSGNRKYGSIEAAGQRDEAGKQFCNPSASWVVDISGSGTVRSVMAKGDVRLINNAKITEKLWSEGSLVTQNNANAQGDVKTGVAEVELAPVPEVTVEAEKFDAYDFEKVANYVFRPGGAVYVRNINGVEDGEYQLPPPGFPAGNPVYSNGTWTLANTGDYQVPPGTLWFEGDLELTNKGKWRNTFIATGNIRTANNQELHAPNYAGEVICSHVHFPEQFCQGADNGFKPVDAVVASIGNYSLMAGSVDPDRASYVGGDITTRNNTEIYGSILAGNDFISTNKLMLAGFITAQAHRTPTGASSIANKTDIILKNLPPTYIPIGGIEWCPACNAPPGSSGTGLPEVTVLWSRYH